MSGDAVAKLSREDAERLTERIRHTAVTFMEARDQLAALIREAQDGNAHEVLGYRSWTEYIAEVFSDTPLMQLTRDQRRELVSELADEGMSTRAIAPVVGASNYTISKDLQGVRDLAPDAEPRQITGRDGKTYTTLPNPEQPKPKRRPLTDTARDLGLDMKTLTDRARKLSADDRLRAQKSEVAPHLRHHLAQAIEALTDLNNQIN